MKYKVGDKVKVREDLEIEKKYGECYFVGDMEKYKGKQTTIKEVHIDNYDLDIDGDCYYWADEMLEPVAESIADSDENTDEVSTNLVESNKFTKEDLKFGDLVTLRNGDTLVYTGIATMRNSEDMEFAIANYNSQFNYDDNSDLDIMKVKRMVLKEGFFTYRLKLLYERKEILTEKEKEYLGKVIEPFRERVKAITKFNTENEEWLYLNLNRENRIDDFPLPTFKKGTTYKGMEIGKEYTLEELGL